MESLKKQTAKLLGEQKKYRRWLAVFLCLAIVVTAGTTAALKLNGQALSHKQKVLECREEVHVHTAECYESGLVSAAAPEDGEEIAVCGYADYVVHVHNDDCYDGKGELVCGLEQIESHVHEQSCYEEQVVSECGLEESQGHQHTEACRALICGEEESETDGNHQHTEECRALVCGLEESEGHQHIEGCRSIQNELTCENAQEGHEHTDSCYQQVETLTCGMEEGEGHIHADACYDAHACGLEETVSGHVHTENCYDPYACGIEEGEEGHIHTDSCCQVQKTIICGQLELHTHVTEGVGSCYDGEGKPICGIPELKEHVHGEDCFVTAELTKEEVEAMQSTEENAAESEEAGESKVERTLYQKSFANEFIKVIAEYDEAAGIPVEAELFAEQVSGTAEETDIEGVTDTAVTTESLAESGVAAEGEGTEADTGKNEADVKSEPTDGEEDSIAETPVSEGNLQEETDTGETAAETEEETESRQNTGVLETAGEDVTGLDPDAQADALTGAEDASDVPQTTEDSSASEADQVEDNIDQTAEPAQNGAEEGLQGRMEILPREVTYRIGFRLEGEEIEPLSSVTFTVWNLEAEEKESQTILWSGDNGSSKPSVTLTRMVEVFVQTEFQKVYEDESIRVTAQYEATAEIPAEAELRVRRITPESDPDHFARREEEFKEQVGDENAAMDVLLNIGFFDNDREIEPKDTVTITLQFLDSEGMAVGAPIDMVHFAENASC